MGQRHRQFETTSTSPAQPVSIGTTTMPINPQVQALLDEFSKQGLPPFDQMSVTQARLVSLGFRDLQGEPEDIGEVRDILVPGPAGSLPVRVYHPSPGKL